MPYCTAYDFFRIKGADAIYTDMYRPTTSGIQINGFDVYVSFTNWGRSEYPRLQVYNLSGTHWAWGLFTSPSSVRYRSSIIYTTTAAVVDCPHNLVWVHSNGQIGTLPNVYGNSWANIQSYFVANIIP